MSYDIFRRRHGARTIPQTHDAEKIVPSQIWIPAVFTPDPVNGTNSPRGLGLKFALGRMKLLAPQIRCFELLFWISVLQVQSRIQHHDNTTPCASCPPSSALFSSKTREKESPIFVTRRASRITETGISKSCAETCPSGVTVIFRNDRPGEKMGQIHQLEGIGMRGCGDDPMERILWVTWVEREQ